MFVYLAKNIAKSDNLILGVGNPFRHDDGVGPKIIEILRSKNIQNADLLDGGTDGLALLDVLSQYQDVVIIDAVNMGAEPGTVKLFTPEEARLKIKSDTLSTHGFGIAEVIRLMQELGIKTHLQIIGVQPCDLSFGEGLSEVVKQALSEILFLINQGAKH